MDQRQQGAHEGEAPLQQEEQLAVPMDEGAAQIVDQQPPLGMENGAENANESAAVAETAQEGAADDIDFDNLE